MPEQKPDFSQKIVSAPAAVEGIQATKKAQGDVMNEGAVRALMDRLRKGGVHGSGAFKDEAPQERVEKPMPSLRAVRDWQRPADRPSDVRTEAQVSVSARSERTLRTELHEEVTKLEADPRNYRLRTLIRGDLFNYTPGLGVEWQNPPTELSALAILLHTYGADLQDRGREEMQDSIRKTIKILRPSGWTSSGMDGPTVDPSAVNKIIEQINAQKENPYGRVRNRPVTNEEFDVAVLSAFACGDPVTALKLISKADQVRFEDASMARYYAVSRLLNTNVLQETYRMATHTIRRRLDTALASLGENQLSELGDVPQTNAQLGRLKQEAEGRLRQEFRNERNAFVESQRVADMGERAKPFEEIAFRQLVEDAVAQSKKWEDVSGRVAQASDAVVDGIVANALAGEIMRRITPQATEEQWIAREKISMWHIH